MECFTLGWLNLIMQALWTPVLEKHIAGLVTELLQRVMNEVCLTGRPTFKVRPFFICLVKASFVLWALCHKASLDVGVLLSG